MRPRNVGAARATLTREDSEWSQKFEEPWQEGWACFSPRPRQRACQGPLTRQGADALTLHQFVSPVYNQTCIWGLQPLFTCVISHIYIEESNLLAHFCKIIIFTK
jgi:hypothetical protein